MLTFLVSLCCLPRILRGDRGASAVEYSLIVVLIAAVIAGVVMFLGTQVRADFQSVLPNW